MIYGVIPAGGKGTRLGLPFPKEMLPQPGYDYYNPVINHIVQNMREAGASKIYFVHDLQNKTEIINYFSQPEYIHIAQQESGFANILLDFYHNALPNDNDQILFGMGDTIFKKNPFPKMLRNPDITCGIFKTDNLSKVDRLTKEKKFQVKTIKDSNNLNLFWGVLKFDGKNIRSFITDKMFDNHSEIGDILNNYPFSIVRGASYIDIGTWKNYNRYITS